MANSLAQGEPFPVAYTVGPRLFELGYFEFSVISNSKPFPLDLPLSLLLSDVSNSRYFELFSFPLRVRNSTAQLYVARKLPIGENDWHN